MTKAEKERRRVLRALQKHGIRVPETPPAPDLGPVGVGWGFSTAPGSAHGPVFRVENSTSRHFKGVQLRSFSGIPLAAGTQGVWPEGYTRVEDARAALVYNLIMEFGARLANLEDAWTHSGDQPPALP